MNILDTKMIFGSGSKVTQEDSKFVVIVGVLVLGIYKTYNDAMTFALVYKKQNNIENILILKEIAELRQN